MSAPEKTAADRLQAIEDARRFQRHRLLRCYGGNGRVLPICLEASNHFTALIEIAEANAPRRPCLSKDALAKIVETATAEEAVGDPAVAAALRALLDWHGPAREHG